MASYKKLWCEAGAHEWERLSQRGRLPLNCPNHHQSDPPPQTKKLKTTPEISIQPTTAPRQGAPTTDTVEALSVKMEGLRAIKQRTVTIRLLPEEIQYLRGVLGQSSDGMAKQILLKWGV